MTYKFHATQPQQPTVAGKDILLAPGLSSFCVDQFGQYDLTFAGCHTYDTNALRSFQTGDELPLAINAIKHRNGIRILSDVRSVFKVAVEGGGAKQYITPLEDSQKINGKFSYRHDFDLKPNERLSLTPESEVMLFTPAKTEIIGADDCVEVIRPRPSFEIQFVQFHSILFFPECIHLHCGQRSHHKREGDATNCRRENHSVVLTKSRHGSIGSIDEC